MPNPVRAARKAGRSLVKDTKQTIKADKITKRYEAKADKIGMKSRAAASAAKAKSQAKAGVTPSTVSKIEPLKINQQIPAAAPLKYELAKPSASAIAAKEAAFKPTPKATPKKTAPKKKTSSKKTTTPKTTTETGRTDQYSPWIQPKLLGPYKAENSRSSASTRNKKYLANEQAQREANYKAEQEQQNKKETRRLFRGPLTVNYRKKGGSVKSKKK
jgi:hypothetical protein